MVSKKILQEHRFAPKYLAVGRLTIQQPILLYSDHSKINQAAQKAHEIPSLNSMLLIRSNRDFSIQSHGFQQNGIENYC